MAKFSDFMNTERMDVPDERKAEDLTRVDQRFDSGAKLRETSVSASRYRGTLVFIRIIIGIILALAAAFLIYKGISFFIPSNK